VVGATTLDTFRLSVAPAAPTCLKAPAFLILFLIVKLICSICSPLLDSLYRQKKDTDIKRCVQFQFARMLPEPGALLTLSLGLPTRSFVKDDTVPVQYSASTDHYPAIPCIIITLSYNILLTCINALPSTSKYSASREAQLG
jgi:hypothetical protein